MRKKKVVSLYKIDKHSETICHIYKIVVKIYVKFVVVL